MRTPYFLVALLLLSCSPVAENPAAPAADGAPPADAGIPTPDTTADPDLYSTVPVAEAGTASNCNESHPDRTVGLLSCTPQAEDGYTLLTPLNNNTYLLDMQGRVVHTWKTGSMPGLVAYLMDDGRLLRPADNGGTSVNQAGGQGGRGEIFAPDGTLHWSYEYCKDGSHCQHHDVAPMPNGNVLILAWERKSRAEAIAAGVSITVLKKYQAIWVDHLIEVQPVDKTGGKVVWEWHLWDHYVQDHDAGKANFGDVKNSPGKVDINYQALFQDGDDISHINSVQYNAKLDQILLSIWSTHEVAIIDHGTTTSEAKGGTGGKQGKGGDLLYRWGNPAAYRTGVNQDRHLHSQHDATWIPQGYPGAGNLLIFNNGIGRTGGHAASVDEIVTPVTSKGAYPLSQGKPYGPAILKWTHTAANLLTMVGGSAQRLKGGNTLISSAVPGRIVEVTPAGKVVWHYINPVTSFGPVKQGHTFTSPEQSKAPIVMKARRYPPDHPGIKKLTLKVQGYLELPSGS